MKYVHIYANIISTTIQQGELSHRTVGRSADKLMVRGLHSMLRPVDLHLFSAHDAVPYPNYAHIYVYTVYIYIYIYIYIVSSNSSIIFIIEIHRISQKKHKTLIKHIPYICWFTSSSHLDEPRASAVLKRTAWPTWEVPWKPRGGLSQNLEKTWENPPLNCPSKKSNDVK